MISKRERERNTSESPSFFFTSQPFCLVDHARQVRFFFLKTVIASCTLFSPHWRGFSYLYIFALPFFLPVIFSFLLSYGDSSYLFCVYYYHHRIACFGSVLYWFKSIPWSSSSSVSFSCRLLFETIDNRVFSFFWLEIKNKTYENDWICKD